MSNCIPTRLNVAGSEPGQVIPGVIAYLPFSGATFAAQEEIGFGDVWRVVHVLATGLIPPSHASFASLDTALSIAGQLSRDCPDAANVTLGLDGKPQGPFPRMRDQIIASLKTSPPTGA